MSPLRLLVVMPVGGAAMTMLTRLSQALAQAPEPCRWRLRAAASLDRFPLAWESWQRPSRIGPAGAPNRRQQDDEVLRTGRPANLEPVAALEIVMHRGGHFRRHTVDELEPLLRVGIGGSLH
jgi:hypothetical protein